MPFVDTILLFQVIQMHEHYIYETHTLSDTLLPFIYHPEFVRTGPCPRINWHENIEFLYCTEGEGYVQCGREIFPFRPNDLFVVNADTLHTTGSQNSVTYQCLIVDRSFFIENGISFHNLYFQNTIRDPQVSILFSDIAEAYRNFDPHTFCAAAEIRCKALNFLLFLCRNYTAKQPSASTYTDPAIKEAIVYMRRHINHPITLDLLSTHIGLSKYHLSRQFKLATGKTIIEYMNLTRCTEAKRLMEAGASVSAAALCCGYENLSYFSRTYKRLMGELPSAAAGKK